MPHPLTLHMAGGGGIYIICLPGSLYLQAHLLMGGQFCLGPCESAAVGFSAYLLPLSRLLGSVIYREWISWRRGVGRGFACNSPIHCHPTPDSLSPAHRHILLARAGDLIGTAIPDFRFE